MSLSTLALAVQAPDFVTHPNTCIQSRLLWGSAAFSGEGARFSLLEPALPSCPGSTTSPSTTQTCVPTIPELHRCRLQPFSSHGLLWCWVLLLVPLSHHPCFDDIKAQKFPSVPTSSSLSSSYLITHRTGDSTTVCYSPPPPISQTLLQMGNHKNTSVYKSSPQRPHLQVMPGALPASSSLLA